MPLTKTALSKEPRAIAHPGLNVSVGASLLGQFGNDNVDLEWVGERRIERDQSNATPIRRWNCQTTRQCLRSCSASSSSSAAELISHSTFSALFSIVNLST